MRRIPALLIFTICLFNVSFAQTTRTGSFIPGTTLYPISGDVTVSINGNTILVEFENNFSTVQGINLEVFLAHSNVLNYATDEKISTTPLDVGSSLGDPITGMHSFTVPTGINLFDYDNVLIQCTSAAVLWGYANLCESVLNISSIPLPSDSYTAESEIICNSMLDLNSDVSFETQNAIELNAAFEAPISTNFSALIGPNLGCIVE